MPLFLLPMLVGLLGLAAMAVPGLMRHGHGGHGHAGQGHGGHAHGARGHPGARHARAGQPRDGLLRLLPEPRAAFSLLALYGAFGNVLDRSLHLPLWEAAALALPAGLLVEAAMVRPLWRLSLRFQGRPSSPLTSLVLEPATAVTGFRNGRGLVSVVRDGRTVQLSARLTPAQAELPVRVGDRLRIEDVDPERERVTVSIL